jgi:hypothetical protein
VAFFTAATSVCGRVAIEVSDDGPGVRLALPAGPPPDPGRPARDQLAMSTS